jgi:hypothetical protein
MTTDMHRYPFHALTIIFGYLGIAIGALFLIGFLTQVLVGGEVSNSYVVDVLSVVLPSIVGSALLNLFPEIQISEGGLRILVFGFHWMFVPWRDVVSMTELASPYQTESLRGMVVKVRGLTLMHLLLVASLGNELARGFIVFNSISGYDQLVETLQQHLKEGATID